MTKRVRIQDEIMSNKRNKTSYYEEINGERKWYKNGKLHREGDNPGHILKDGTSLWYKNGKLHRNRWPAYMSKNRFEWYKNGELHNDDGPAIVYIENDGKMISYYYFRGALHNDDGPAIDCSKYKLWYNRGSIHRENDLPAKIEFYENGLPRVERWYTNGFLHRENAKPAVINYSENGNIASLEYWVNGQRIK